MFGPIHWALVPLSGKSPWAVAVPLSLASNIQYQILDFKSFSDLCQTKPIQTTNFRPIKSGRTVSLRTGISLNNLSLQTLG